MTFVRLEVVLRKTFHSLRDWFADRLVQFSGREKRPNSFSIVDYQKNMDNFLRDVGVI